MCVCDGEYEWLDENSRPLVHIRCRCTGWQFDRETGAKRSTFCLETNHIAVTLLRDNKNASELIKSESHALTHLLIRHCPLPNSHIDSLDEFAFAGHFLSMRLRQVPIVSVNAMVTLG